MQNRWTSSWATVSSAVLFVINILALISIAMSADITMITKDDLKAMLGNKDVVILDVRMDVEWESSEAKIKGAVWENPKLFEIWAEKYPKDITLVLYCD